MFTILEGPMIVGSLLTLAGVIGLWGMVLRLWPGLAHPVLGDDTPDRLNAMDGLRGVLALGVFMTHAIMSRRYFGGQGWTPPAGHFTNLQGQVAVALFFMISAYLFWGRVVASAGQMNWPAFYRGRAYRLMPVYYVAVGILLAIVAGLSHGVLQVTPVTVLKQIAHWLPFGMIDRPDINQQPASLILGVAWTLKYEWLFYLALPILAWFYRTIGYRTWPLAVLVFLYSLRNNNASMYAYFAAGFIAVHALHRPMTNRVKIIIAGLAVIMMPVIGFGFHNLRGQPLAVIPIFILFLACLQAIGPWRILLLRPLRFLGHISYSVYLLHFPLLFAAVHWVIGPTVYSQLPDHLFYPLCMIVGLAITAVSTVTFLMIEQPWFARRHARVTSYEKS